MAAVTRVWVAGGSSRQQAVTIKNLDGGVINDQAGANNLQTSRQETLQHLPLHSEGIWGVMIAWVTAGHLRFTLGHIRATVGHFRVIKGHLRVSN